MKSAEIEMLLMSLQIGDTETVRKRLESERDRVATLSKQKYQVFVACNGRMQETLAESVYGFLTEKEPGAVNVEFFAYVNSELHTAEVTKEGTLVADTVTIYTPPKAS